MDNINEDSILRCNNKKSKLPGISVIFMGLIIIGMAVVLIMDANKKEESFVAAPAKVSTVDKLYEAGKPYYKVKYVYVVDDKKYYYNDPEKHFNGYDEVITIKYNKSNPNDIYISGYYIYFIVLCGIGVVVFILGIIKLIALTSKDSEKIIVGEIFDSFTCIGGKKFYIRSLDSNFNPLPDEKTEYFSYFSNDFNNFVIGRKVKFNAYKYGDVLLTEAISNNKEASSINSLKTTDFIFYK